MSKDTIPATDEQIAGLRSQLETMEFPTQQYFSMIGSEALSLIARIEADKEKIEQLEFEAEWADSKIKALQAEITTWKQTAEQRANDCVVYQTEITALKGLLVQYRTGDGLDRASKGEL